MTTKWKNTNWILISRNTRINADTSSPFHFGRSKTSTPTKTKDFKWHNMCSYYEHCQAVRTVKITEKIITKNFIPASFHVLCVTWHLIIADGINRNKIPAQQKKKQCWWLCMVSQTSCHQKKRFASLNYDEKRWKVKKTDVRVIWYCCVIFDEAVVSTLFYPQRRIQQTIDLLVCENFQ